MSDENNSTSSSESSYDENYGIEPYMHEPTCSKNKVTYINSPTSSSTSSDEESTSRVGNTDWCFCKLCKPMSTVTESLCCHEITEICSDRLNGEIILLIVDLN